jgi:cytidine deaminase
MDALKKYIIEFADLESDEALCEQDRALLNFARRQTQYAYAPYSRFQVAASASLSNGELVYGTNQENASYPAGICAERVLLSLLSSVQPSAPVGTMAISYQNSRGEAHAPIAPCGICRQSLMEYELRYRSKLRLLLAGQYGRVWVFESAAQLLPWAFTQEELGQ